MQWLHDLGSLRRYLRRVDIPHVKTLSFTTSIIVNDDRPEIEVIVLYDTGGGSTTAKSRVEREEGENARAAAERAAAALLETILHKSGGGERLREFVLSSNSVKESCCWNWRRPLCRDLKLMESMIF